MTRRWLPKLGSGSRKLATIWKPRSVYWAEPPPLVAPAAFHTQQAAEKAMKAFLTWNGQVFRKIHSLIEIGDACAKLDPGLAQISSRVAPISGWAVETRYPGEWSSPTDAEVVALTKRHQAVTIARAAPISIT